MSISKAEIRAAALEKQKKVADNLAASQEPKAQEVNKERIPIKGEAGSNEKLKRINLNVPESIHKAFKIKAASESMATSDIIRRWIDQYLSE